ncbi:hypothetical protein M5K25_016742 [Dendrobium thyrsiflorum]|uniref:Uncharacterized protein n=1 Tax=Dendrobium thyrsiflorum TaxID=117978 RepID=A0ABD0UKK7_DENTH
MLEGEVRQLKLEFEKKVSELETQILAIHDKINGKFAIIEEMMRKMLEVQTKMMLLEARGAIGGQESEENPNPIRRREDQELEILDGEDRMPPLEPILRKESGRRYGKRTGADLVAEISKGRDQGCYKLLKSAVIIEISATREEEKLREIWLSIPRGNEFILQLTSYFSKLTVHRLCMSVWKSIMQSTLLFRSLLILNTLIKILERKVRHFEREQDRELAFSASDVAVRLPSSVRLRSDDFPFPSAQKLRHLDRGSDGSSPSCEVIINYN